MKKSLAKFQHPIGKIAIGSRTSLSTAEIINTFISLLTEIEYLVPISVGPEP
ncbi:MAG: hypothetical protein LC127_07480 [Chitinophagales bacterium]|nr:hypothetical protein [Chitinophagales bacterium]